ncbi:hypothetical protein ABBQ38_014628 [Trebouxia sp. C0009 RCD-2024]
MRVSLLRSFPETKDACRETSRPWYVKVDTLRVDLRLVTPVVVAASKHKLDLLSQLDLRFKFLLGSADQLIAEGTFVVTANTYGPQQVNVVLTTKKGYQKGTAVFVLNIGGKSEVWSSPMASPKGGAHAGYASQGPLAVSASSVYGMGQPMPMPVSLPMSMPMQQGFAQQQQGYQGYAEQSDRGMLPVNSPAPQPSSPHSLLPQGRGSITYGSAGYIQGDQTAYAAQGYSQGMQHVQRASSGSSMASGQQAIPAGYPMQGPQVDASFSSSTVNMAQAQALSPPPAAHHGPAPSLGQQFFTHVEERPVTKEVVTYVQERRPVAKQYVVETRYTGEEHEIEGAGQQQILGHHERIIAAPPVNFCTSDQYM